MKIKIMKGDKLEDIDQLIRDTLSEEEAKFYDDLDEQNVFQMLIGVFNGKNKWIMYLMNFMTLIFFGLFIYCIVQFFNTDVTNELIKWGFGVIIFLLGVSMLKVYIWMQMDKNALMRELKRLELQISSIAGKMSE